MHKPGPGERFLHQKDATLQTSQPVEHEQKRIHRQGQETSQKSANKITTWLQLLERTHMGHADEPRVLERIKESYHRQYVTLTLDDIPQSYWNNKAKIMIAQGYGGDMTHSGIHKEEYTDEHGNVLDSGLLDEIYIDVEPLVFGDGIPLFTPSNNDLKLTLLETKKIGASGVQLHYKVLK